MPNAHDTAVQMIDTSVVRVPQYVPCIVRNGRQCWSRGGLTSKIHAIVETGTQKSDHGPAKSTRAGADGTQARAGLFRSKRP
jgi:hypothetical protein